MRDVIQPRGPGCRPLDFCTRVTTIPSLDGDRTSVQDASVWEWFSTSAGRHDSSEPTGEITYPRRLVQQIESEEEIVRESLDTRVKNGTVEKLVR